jgi:hypothetical protein
MSKTWLKLSLMFGRWSDWCIDRAYAKTPNKVYLHTSTQAVINTLEKLGFKA